jgi:hypothetical protein
MCINVAQWPDNDNDDVNLSNIKTCGLQNLLSICVRKTHREKRHDWKNVKDLEI